MKNQMTGAEAVVRMLEAYHVQHIFGLCGDTTLPFYDAMARLDHDITHILTRDERHAGYMADGYARVTGKPGICEGPSGGGATYILPALVEAGESSIPVLGITTDVATTSRGKYPLTELDQVSLFKPVTKWNASLDQVNQLPAQIRAAFRAMTTGRPGSAHLALPFDTQKAAIDPDLIWADPSHAQFPAARQSANKEDLERLAELLLAAKRPVMICGGGPLIAGAMGAISWLAETLNMAIATTVSGQGVIAETHPCALGVVGSNGGVKSTRAVVDDADVVLFVGCRAGSVTTERWRSPAHDKTILHIDSDPMVPGANYNTAASVIADAGLALEALVDIIKGKDIDGIDFDGKARAADAWAKKLADFNPLAQSNQRPITPEAVIHHLSAQLDNDGIVVADPGTPCPYVSAHYRWPQAGRHFITNRAHGALGFGMAAAMGAHIGRPSVKTVALMGDGSFGFCCGEFETMTRYRMPITSIVFSNATYGWIKAGQKTGFGERYHNVDFNRTDHAAVASAFGVKSWRVEDPAELPRVMRQALDHDGPTLIDVISQPLHEAAAPVSEWVA
ncbi:MAG: thiamine pyrophosphate-binding protein [Candidatus Puniceispirillales bacterium]|nr:thiamine pyrophosphate-binding protein [Pseudomonadota bacterium]